MKIRIIASVLLIALLSFGVSSNAEAQHWRGGRGWHGGYRHGWYGPHVGVGVWAPPVPVAPRVVIGGGYGPGYYGGGYYGPHYGYRRGYYGHGYYHGGYRHGGGYGHRR